MAAAGLGGLAWHFLIHSDNGTPPELPPGMEVSMHNVRYVRTDNGRVVWRLSAETAEKSIADGTTTALDVSAVLYLSDREKITITARRGVMTSDQQTVMLLGNVCAARGDWWKLAANEITYSQKTGLLKSDSTVRFSARGITVSGTGMILDIRRHNVRLMHEVEAEIDEDA